MAPSGSRCPAARRPNSGFRAREPACHDLRRDVAGLTAALGGRMGSGDFATRITFCQQVLANGLLAVCHVSNANGDSAPRAGLSRADAASLLRLNTRTEPSPENGEPFTASYECVMSILCRP